MDFATSMFSSLIILSVEGLELFFKNDSLITLVLSLCFFNLSVVLTAFSHSDRKILGINYQSFIFSKYLIFKKLLRIPYRLYFMTLVSLNILFVFLLVLPIVLFVRMIFFIGLVLVTVLFLRHAYHHVLGMNKATKEQIMIFSLSTLYRSEMKSESMQHKKTIDELLDMPQGKATTRRVNTNVSKYFDEDSFEVSDVFEDAFSIKSPIYSYINSKIKKERKLYKRILSDYQKTSLGTNNEEEVNKSLESPIKYREVAVWTLDTNGLKDRKLHKPYDISYEFFQMIRQNEIPDVWCIRMYDLSSYDECNTITYSNIVRIAYNISYMVSSPRVRTHKFLSFLVKKYIKHFDVAITENPTLKLNQAFTEANVKECEKRFILAIKNLATNGMESSRSLGLDDRSSFQNVLEEISSADTVIEKEEKRVMLKGII